MDDATTGDPAQLTAVFRRDGYVRLAEPVPASLIVPARQDIERLELDRGARRASRAELHVSPNGLERLVMHRPPASIVALSGFGRLADAVAACLAEASDPRPANDLEVAPTVVAWGYEVLTKHPGEADDAGTVGWHQDRPYFAWWEGPTLTAWIALTDVGADSAPVAYVRGSHRWGDRFDTTAFDASPQSTRSVGPPPGTSWDDVPIEGPAGTTTIHHPGTIHGSGVNRTSSVRRALAVRLRSGTTRLRDDTPPRLRRALGG